MLVKALPMRVPTKEAIANLFPNISPNKPFLNDSTNTGDTFF